MVSMAPSERSARAIDQIIIARVPEPDPIEANGRLGARLILQQALEELSEFSAASGRSVAASRSRTKRL